MHKDNLYRTETTKSIQHFIEDFSEIASQSGFIINNTDTMNMARSFTRHGVETSPDFDLHMIQICKPEKAAQSLAANPERAVLMPKFIMAFSKNDATQIRFLSYGADDIAAVVDDSMFPGSLAQTYDRIISMIEDAR